MGMLYEYDVADADRIRGAFPARYGGRCAACGHSIHRGEIIRPSDDPAGKDKFEHTDCPELGNDIAELTPHPEKYGDVCPECYLRHRGECL